MVTTTASYTHSCHRTAPGEGYDGIARVGFGGYHGTGSLLFDGRAILTAAHLFECATGAVNVTFETRSGTHTVSASNILEHPGYDADGNNDLAIVWLSKTAPLAANRYALYRDSDEIGQAFTFSGYGQTGVGSTGGLGTDNLIRLKAANRFDADTSQLETALGSSMDGTPLAATQLIADFDNGTTANDAPGRLMNRNDLGGVLTRS